MFDVRSPESKILYFNEVLLSESYKISSKKNGGYLSWHLKVTCSFKYDMRNFVNFLPTNQKSKSFASMGFNEVWAKRNTEKVSSITLDSGAKIE